MTSFRALLITAVLVYMCFVLCLVLLGPCSEGAESSPQGVFFELFSLDGKQIREPLLV